MRGNNMKVELGMPTANIRMPVTSLWREPTWTNARVRGDADERNLRQLL
jgi:hypothetical protein